MDHFERIFDKLDELNKEVVDSRLTQAKMFACVRKNTSDLEKHIKRTDMLEDFIKLHTEDTKKHKTPLTVAELVGWLMKLVGGMASVFGLIWVLYQLLGVK